VPIISKNNYIYATLSICHSVWMTLWWNSTLHTRHPYRITITKCRIDTVISPDDGHIVARSMYKKEINKLRKIVHQVGFIYKNNSSQLANKFPFLGNSKVLLRAHHSPSLVPILSQINPVQALPSYFILSFHLRLGLRSNLFPSGFHTQTIFLHNSHVSPRPIPLYLITRIIFSVQYQL